VPHCGLAIALKSVSRKKKELWKPCKNIIFKKSFKKKPKPDIIILELISSFNTSQNIIFQKSSHKNRPITYYGGAKIPEATVLYNESKHNILALVN
jgi:hypothetical protein